MSSKEEGERPPCKSGWRKAVDLLADLLDGLEFVGWFLKLAFTLIRWMFGLLWRLVE
ncbi:hypothetical protein [Methylocystis sp. JR02]|uniref:hypothetical protein n=1 Tax=Methylocystis sp. JR02 TaxID=3046284 RepID=UPI0024B9E4EA|nr:hypothetical protein [Methylocystis sp. JR02]MDJ0449780.1 hypothetical protein [Methylocystis sp. JR02]